MLLTAILLFSIISTGCSEKNSEVIIYSNADDEAVEAIKTALDNNGYAGKYIFQSFGTSELGGKLLAEGKQIEADLITMSSYYIESAQQKNNIMLDLKFSHDTLTDYPTYCTSITAQEGALIINTKLIKENKLAVPKSIKDLIS